MPCYIIQCGDTDFVKIGWTDGNVNRRLRYLQCSHHAELRVLRVIEGERAIEKWMHRYFRQHHVRNEWFRLVPEMLTVSIEELWPPPVKMSAERRAQIAASMRKSWHDGSLRRTFNIQRAHAAEAA